MIRKPWLILFVVLFASLLSACGGDDGIGGSVEMVSKTYLSVDKSSIAFGAEGGTKTIVVSSNASWAIEGIAVGWLYLDVYDGEGNGTITVTASANTGKAREAKLSVKGADVVRTINVTQEATKYPTDGDNVPPSAE